MSAPGWALSILAATVAVPATNQTPPAADGGSEQAEAPAPDRPEACLSGELGPIRVQIGSVEAATEVGKEVAVPVRVKGVCDLGGFKFGVGLDRRIADLVRTEATEFLRGDPPLDYEFLPAGPERYVVAAGRPKGAPGVDGIGTLARLIFRGRRVGSTQVELLHLQLYDSRGELLESFGVPLRLTVIPTPDSGWKPYGTPKIKKKPAS